MAAHSVAVEIHFRRGTDRLFMYSVVDSGFSRGGGTNPLEEGASTYDFAYFPLDPPRVLV